ncbi:MAG: hypothetical protein QF535_04000 [Anaerolineales bacterium]|jgi:hypothetical protein|nr:hypothetical protein [Anaerolineales bacterium]
MSFLLKYTDDQTGEVLNEYQSNKIIVNGNCGNFSNIMHQLSLWGACSVINVDSAGAETTTEADYKGYKYTYELYNWREKKKLPFLITSKLNGMANSRVEHVTEGTESLGGEFTVNINGEPVLIHYDETAAWLKSNITALTNITSEDIEVSRGGDCHFGCTWWVNWVGEKIEILVEEVDMSQLTSDGSL